MNIYTSITDKFALDTAIGLVESGHNIVAVEINTVNPDRYPKELEQFLDKYLPKIYYEEITYNIKTFKIKSDPDFSIITPSFLSKTNEYIRMMLLIMDRLYFSPLSQHEAQRMVYLYLAHYYKILKDCEVDVVLFKDMPHGLAQIALFAVAKAIGIQFIFRSGVTPTHYISYLEEELLPRKRLEYQQIKTASKNLKQKISFDDYRDQLFSEIPEVISFKTNPKPIRVKQLAKLIYNVIRGKKDNYQLSQFFLEKEKLKVTLIISILKYHFDREMQIRFLKNIQVDPSLDEDYFIFYLHFQPEATTTPAGNYFSDQLLNLQIILSALPLDSILYVKEHPAQWDYVDNYGQDMHFRSIDFYKEILKDNRVQIISNNLEPSELIKNAKAVFSTSGSVSWEAINLGKPAIVFSYLWCVTCDSCYIAYSSNDVKAALLDSSKKTSSDVYDDRENFIKSFYNVVIWAVERKDSLLLVDERYDYELALNNVINSINKTIKEF